MGAADDAPDAALRTPLEAVVCLPGRSLVGSLCPARGEWRHPPWRPRGVGSSFSSCDGREPPGVILAVPLRAFAVVIGAKRSSWLLKLSSPFWSPWGLLLLSPKDCDVP